MLAHGLTMRRVYVDIAPIDSHLHQRDQLANYSLIIVDTDRTDGVVVCRQLREEYKNPVLFLTYESDERYHLQVYATGVDECIQKPIGNSLFLAKVDVWLRSVNIYKSQRRLSNHGFKLDAPRRQLTTPTGEIINLTNLEVRLFTLFINNPEMVLDTETIIRRVWDDYTMGDATLLKNLVYRVRRKIEPAPGEPQYLQTAFGGYVFYPNS